MAGWKDAVTKVASQIEDHYDALRFQMRQRMGIGPVHLLPYLGYVARGTVHLNGRVLENYAVTPAEDNDTYWRNLLNMYRRFNSHEIPGARVRARLGDWMQEVAADAEGFFELRIPLSQPLLPEQTSVKVALELVDYAGQDGAQATGEALAPAADAQFGVISDLDDTVMQTDVVHLLKMARNTFLGNSRTRLPFAGVAEFYRALQQGTRATRNPIYYVSNMAWNLYDLMVDFFQVRGIPPGAMFLAALGLTRDQLLRPNPFEHKSACIDTLLDAHPDLPFILIGDSGEHDPDIYLKAVQRHPGRIKAIYIRDVTEQRRDEEVKKIIIQAQDAGAEMLLVPDTVSAARHAAEKGFILPEASSPILKESEADKGEPDPVEAATD